jgi:hypothetical protein
VLEAACQGPGRKQPHGRRTTSSGCTSYQTERELAMLNTQPHQMKLETQRRMLAKTAMTLDTQRELNATDNLVDHP